MSGFHLDLKAPVIGAAGALIGMFDQKAGDLLAELQKDFADGKISAEELPGIVDKTIALAKEHWPQGAQFLDDTHALVVQGSPLVEKWLDSYKVLQATNQ